MPSLSFIVPAHNEERWIGRCLESICAAAEPLGERYEVIVVDDASTDRTREIAEGRGAQVVRVELRRVGKVRNAGAAVAAGGSLFFVDADTEVNPAAVRAGLEILRSGAAGGGCVFEFDGRTPWWSKPIHRFGVAMGRLLQLTGGCFVFCTREAYDAVGGFSEELRAGEDMAFVQSLKRTGRFVVPEPAVLTSGRKLEVVGFVEVVRLVGRILIRGSGYEDEKTLDFMYGERAEACRREGPGTEG